MVKKKSEFGKGLVICLVKFAEHMENSEIRPLIQGIYTDYDTRMLKDVYGDNKEKFLSSKLERWANGASDHLYEIEVPKGWVAISKKVEELKSLGLEMGHGWTGKTWTEKHYHTLINLTREISLMIDKKIGLKPLEGEW